MSGACVGATQGAVSHEQQFVACSLAAERRPLNVWYNGDYLRLRWTCLRRVWWRLWPSWGCVALAGR